jgi:hypothetical protein
MNDKKASHAHITEPSYGRVTNAARFAMLHSVALELLDQLQSDFDVERIAPYESDEDLDRFARLPLARSTVALGPQDRDVRHWSLRSPRFPVCWCESADITGWRSRVADATHAMRTLRERPIDSGGSCTLSQPDTSASTGKARRRHGDSRLGVGAAGQHWREQLTLKSTHASRVKLGSISHWKPWIGRRVR